MQYLIYVLAFIPCTIGLITAPQGVLSFACQNAQGRPMKIPIAETRSSVQSSCSIRRAGGKKITEFPKAFKPGFNQKMLAPSASGKFYISPINPVKYPNIFAVTSEGCDLAAVMMAGPRGLRDSQRSTSTTPATSPAGSFGSRPGSPQSVRTRPGSPQSVRTFRPVVARSESSTGKIKKRLISGSDLKLCTPVTYDWNSDISGTGRQVGNVPVPGRRVAF